MPLTDVLYFEYLRSLLIRYNAVRVIIGRWHPTNVQRDLFYFEDTTDWSTYDAYVDSLFRDFRDRVRIIDGKELLKMHHGQLPPLFWNSLDRVSNPEKFWSIARSIRLTMRERRQIRRRKPGDRLKGFVGHTMNNTMLAPIVAQELKGAAASRPSLGILFWGMEVDRLAVFLEMYAVQGRDATIVDFSLIPIAGKTIRGRRGSPSDNHDPTLAISFTGTETDRIQAVVNKSRAEVRQYRVALEAVLRSNYSFSEPRAALRSRAQSHARIWTAAAGGRVRLNGTQCELVYLLSELVRAHLELRSTASDTAI